MPVLCRGALLVVLAAMTAGCVRTQRLAKPMFAEGLPKGAAVSEPGPEEVLVIRHADPVQVRPPGITGSYPLTFYRKTVRVNAGTWVLCEAGGRVEVLWPDGSSIVLFGRGGGQVGSASRGEPVFALRLLDHARVEMQSDDQVELLGGAVLHAPPGEFLIEQITDEVQRVKNHSNEFAQVEYRDEVVQIGPGEVCDIPILDGGRGLLSAPRPADPAEVALDGGGFPVRVTGEVETVRGDGALAVRTLGEHELRGLGVSVRLDAGERATFSGLGPYAVPDSPTPPDQP